MTQTLMTRENNTLTLYPGTDEEVQASIPSDVSALSILGLNPVHPGDRFDGETYMVHRRGQDRPKKWFSYMEGWNHFWKPLLQEPARLELAYQRAQVRHQARYDRLWAHIRHIMQTTTRTKGRHYERAWRVHAEPTRPQNQSPNQCWYYDINLRDDDPESPSYGFEWVEKPRRFRHLDLGNELYRLEQIAHGSNVLRGLAVALDQALQLRVQREFPDWHDRPETIFELLVNGRHYCYRTVYMGTAVVLTKQAWVGDRHHVITVT